MEHIYNVNGLPFHTEEDLIIRKFFYDMIVIEVKRLLKGQNRSWEFYGIEAPSLIPSDLVNSEYTSDNVFKQQDTVFHLKPETTASSYAYLEMLFTNTTTIPPVCVYQMSKSFRKEQDQPSKFCRFKEFYQLEFQCIYTSTTLNDYQTAILAPLAVSLSKLLGAEARIVESDRLPSYSVKTMDIEVFYADRWMEIASISLRTDFKFAPTIKSKQYPCLNLEIAIGMDRLLHVYQSER